MSFAEQWGPALAAVATVIVMNVLDAAWWITLLAVIVVAVGSGRLIAKRKAARLAVTDRRPPM